MNLRNYDDITTLYCEKPKFIDTTYNPQNEGRRKQSNINAENAFMEGTITYLNKDLWYKPDNSFTQFLYKDNFNCERNLGRMR